MPVTNSPQVETNDTLNKAEPKGAIFTSSKSAVNKRTTHTKKNRQPFLDFPFCTVLRIGAVIAKWWRGVELATSGKGEFYVKWYFDKRRSLFFSSLLLSVLDRQVCASDFTKDVLVCASWQGGLLWRKVGAAVFIYEKEELLLWQRGLRLIGVFQCQNGGSSYRANLGLDCLEIW